MAVEQNEKENGCKPPSVLISQSDTLCQLDESADLIKIMRTIIVCFIVSSTRKTCRTTLNF